MLRTWVLLLLGVNVVLWAYTQGYLATLGWAPENQREPQRLTQQVAPDKLRVVNAPAAGSAQTGPQPVAGDSTAGEATTGLSSPPVTGGVPGDQTAEVTTGPAGVVPPAPLTTARPEPTACWQVGGFTPAQTVLLTGALQNMDGLAPGAWRLTETVLPARWIVYIGKLPNSDAVQRRKAELRQAKVEFRDVYNPALQPGLALGTYSSEEAAQRALRDVARQGVRDARVVQERKESTSVGLSLPALTDAQRRQLLNMGVLGDKTLQPCP